MDTKRFSLIGLTASMILSVGANATYKDVVMHSANVVSQVAKSAASTVAAYSSKAASTVAANASKAASVVVMNAQQHPYIYVGSAAGLVSAAGAFGAYKLFKRYHVGASWNVRGKAAQLWAKVPSIRMHMPHVSVPSVRPLAAKAAATALVGGAFLMDKGIEKTSTGVAYAWSPVITGCKKVYRYFRPAVQPAPVQVAPTVTGTTFAKLVDSYVNA